MAAHLQVVALLVQAAVENVPIQEIVVPEDIATLLLTAVAILQYHGVVQLVKIILIVQVEIFVNQTVVPVYQAGKKQEIILSLLIFIVMDQ